MAWTDGMGHPVSYGIGGRTLYYSKAGHHDVSGTRLTTVGHTEFGKSARSGCVQVALRKNRIRSSIAPAMSY